MAEVCLHLCFYSLLGVLKSMPPVHTGGPLACGGLGVSLQKAGRQAVLATVTGQYLQACPSPLGDPGLLTGQAEGSCSVLGPLVARVRHTTSVHPAGPQQGS